MKNTLYKRFSTIFAVALILCIAVLGMVLLYFAARYFINDRQETMLNVAQSAADYTSSSYETYGYVHRGNTERIYNTLASATDSLLVYADKDGHIRICSDGGECQHLSQTIPARVLEVIKQKGEYRDAGFRVTAISGSVRYTVAIGIPLWLTSTQTAGYILVFTPMAALVAFLRDTLIIIELASLAMIGVITVGMYRFIRRMTQPLREMSKAAISFGNGDFSARVAVSGDDEISSLAKVFNKMADDLVEIDRTRRSFIANVSHELRTPMTTIGGYIDGMLDGTIPSEAHEQYLRIVSDEVKRLSRMTASTLAIARMEEGTLTANLADINVWNVLCTVMFSFEKKITAKKINVVDFSPGEVYAVCDSDMLHQVIYNLVDNAVKFTPENGELRVSVAQTKTQVSITVRNTGVGIPKAELPLVFDRFYKTDKSRGVDKTGSGLGLYIVRMLVQRMDGKIIVASVEDEYCEFTLFLKAAGAEKSEEKPSLIAKLGKGLKRQKKTKEDPSDG